jgi:pteridine reductase
METLSTPLALVTGGAQRVGRAMVESLIERGFRVLFTYHRNASAAKELAAGVADDRAIALPLDLSQTNLALDAIQSQIAARGQGGLSLLVNNASYYATDEQARAGNTLFDFMRVNCHSPQRLTEALSEPLQRAGGSVVNMLDILAQRPMTAYSRYCASKAAFWNVTLAHAKQFAPRVRVNGIAPGVVDWPPDMPETERAKYLSRVPLGRAGTPADVAELVCFLALRGTYITGQVIALDGGRSLV